MVKFNGEEGVKLDGNGMYTPILEAGNCQDRRRTFTGSKRKKAAAPQGAAANYADLELFILQLS